MSKQREAREMRKRVDEQMSKMQPMKVVPSKKGLATVFLFCAALGYATGAFAHWLAVR